MRNIFLLLTCSFIPLLAHAAPPNTAHTESEVIPLWPGQTIDQEKFDHTLNSVGYFKEITIPGIKAYLPPKEIANGTSLLIAPGGGYAALAWLHHVKLLAPLFTSKGIAVIGLQYRTSHPDNTIPNDPLADFNQGIRLIREHAEEWNLKPENIVGLGFSAGSNLLLQYACSEGGEEINYLNFLCLWPYGKESNAYQIEKKNLDVILFAADEDKVAPSAFSVDIAERFNKAGAKAKLIRHEKGNHAAYNFYGNSPTVDWTADFLTWLSERGLVDVK